MNGVILELQAPKKRPMCQNDVQATERKIVYDKQDKMPESLSKTAPWVVASTSVFVRALMTETAMLQPGPVTTVCSSGR